MALSFANLDFAEANFEDFVVVWEGSGVSLRQVASQVLMQAA